MFDTGLPVSFPSITAISSSNLSDMQDERAATLLDYYTRHHTSVQWRGFLTALADEFETQLDTSQLRVLMTRIGARFAASYPAANCTTLDDLSVFLNSVWSALDWGFVRLSEQSAYLSIEHACAPLAAFGERAAAWAPAFLEGAYQYWLSELGAGALRLREAESGAPGIVEFRLVNTPA
jgi:hypothetical protein